MLSGGERALTAVALLFAMLEVRPVPFCVLDEVDAALDEANIGRFADALRSLAHQTQFIVITHNRGTIEAADALYGVTVGDDSVSRVISLRLDEAQALAARRSRRARAGRLMPFWRRRREDEPAEPEVAPSRSRSSPRTSSRAGSPTPPTSRTADAPAIAGRRPERRARRRRPSAEPLEPAARVAERPRRVRDARRPPPAPADRRQRRARPLSPPPIRRARPRRLALDAGLERTRGGFMSQPARLPRRRRRRPGVGRRRGDAHRRRRRRGARDRPRRARPHAGASRAAPRPPSAPSSPRCSSPRDLAWTPQPAVAGRTGGRARRRRQRDRQDDDDRQARQPLRGGGPHRSSSPPPTRSAPPPSTSSGSGPTGRDVPDRRPRARARIPGAVVYDALDAAVARGADLVIADTAGRLHTKSNLMDELTKIRRIIDKRLPGAEPETLFVLDATTGQNGLAQAKAFHEAVGLTGIVLTKLDSTAKGGIVFAIEDALRVPVRFVGVGEGVGDLLPFDPDALRGGAVRLASERAVRASDGLGLSRIEHRGMFACCPWTRRWGPFRARWQRVVAHDLVGRAASTSVRGVVIRGPFRSSSRGSFEPIGAMPDSDVPRNLVMIGLDVSRLSMTESSRAGDSAEVQVEGILVAATSTRSRSRRSFRTFATEQGGTGRRRPASRHAGPRESAATSN